MLAPVWAADGKSVELARSTNLLAGTYTVTVGGIDLGTKVATTDVVAQKLASLEVTTTNLLNSATAKLSFSAKDQYGTEVSTLASTFTWYAVNTTAPARGVTVGATTNKDYVVLDASAAEIGDVVRITSISKTDPTVTTTKDVTISNIYTQTLTLDEVVIPEGETRLNESGAPYNVEVLYTAADNFGTPVVFANTAALTNDYIIVSTNTDLVVPANVSIGSDGELLFQIEANESGEATVTLLNKNTGTTSSILVKVYETAYPNTVVFGDYTIIAGDAPADNQMEATFFDQYGTEMDPTDVAGTNLSANFNATIVGPGGLTQVDAISTDGTYITFTASATSDGTHTFTLVNTTTAAQSSATIVVGEQRVPNELLVETTPDAAIPNGGTTSAVFNVNDQYGDEMTFAAADTLGYYIDAELSNANVSVDNDPLTSYTSVVQGDALGTSTVTYTLYTDEDVAVDNQAFSFKVVDPLASLLVTTDNTEYTAGQQIGVTIKAEKAGNIAHTTYNTTGVATVTVEGVAYLRNVTFVNGVATTTVPATTASVVAGTPDITVNAAFGGFNDDAADVEVIAAAASKLSVNGSDELLVTDAYGNTVDYDFTGIATVVTDGGTFSGTLNTEDQMQVIITNGVVTDTLAAALTFAGATDDVLTMTLANGAVFSITL